MSDNYAKDRSQLELNITRLLNELNALESRPWRKVKIDIEEYLSTRMGSDLEILEALQDELQKSVVSAKPNWDSLAQLRASTQLAKENNKRLTR